ncbi:MAG: hypothetical protein ACWA44_03380 [Thiotrichales bacterium]
MIKQSTAHLPVSARLLASPRLKLAISAFLGAGMVCFSTGLMAAPGGLTFQQSVEAVNKVPGSSNQYAFLIRYIIEDPTSLLETPDSDPTAFEVKADLASAFTDADITFEVSNLENDPTAIAQVNADGETEFNIEPATIVQGFSGIATGGSDNTSVATGTLDDGQRSVVRYTLTVTYANDAKGPVTVTSIMNGQTQSAPLFIPNAVKSQPLSCPDGTTLSMSNQVKNGSFTSPTNLSTPQTPGTALGSFTSDYIYSGDFAALQNGQISIQPGSTGISDPGIFTQPGTQLQQYPFPGDSLNGIPSSNQYLYASGPTDSSADNGAIWKQSITGLTPQATYLFVAYASNPRYVGVDGGDAIITLAANSGDSVIGGNKTKTLGTEAIGDDWTMLSGTIEPGTTTLDLEIRNENQTSSFYNHAVLTGIGLYPCLAPGDKAPASNEATDTGSSPSGGGGGAVALGLVALGALGLRRRRVRVYSRQQRHR